MRDDVSASPWFVRYLLRLRGDSGFTLIEVVFAMILFAGLAAAMAGLLTSAVSANKFARQRTLADQAALEQIEAIRRLDYDDVGTVLGNPPGVVAATTTITKTGLDATITIQIRYVDDPTPTSYETNANYKRVMVSVRRTSDSQLLAREVTYVAPSSRTPFGGVNLAIIQPLVIDYGLNAPIENATVNLLTGPSAPRSDVTDASGSVSFKKLTPNPTAACPPDCYDLTAVLSGYVQLDSPTRVNVAPGQTATPTIQIYRPSTINVLVKDSGGAPYAGTASVKLTSGRNGATQTFSVTGGSIAIPAVAGEQIVPSVQYTAQAWTNGSPSCATAVTKYVPDNYPTVLTSTFTLTLGTCPAGTVAVTVNQGSTPASGATVALSGGPYALSTVTGTTNGSGVVTFSNVPSGAGYTVTATKGGQSATPQTISVTTGSTTNVTMSLPAGSLAVLVRWAGANVNGATVTVTGGPQSVNLTLTTGASGLVTFPDLAPGSGYNVTATKSGQNASGTATISAGSTTNLTLNLPTATLTVNVKRSGANVNGATVTLTLGPMNITVTATTNSSGNATFSNVPVGTGYTIKAYNCSVSNPKSGTLTAQTVNSPTTTINLAFSTNTCPLP
jgi:prepilin-type N-terminal cleavage/methylation domain-containing protein